MKTTRRFMIMHKQTTKQDKPAVGERALLITTQGGNIQAMFIHSPRVNWIDVLSQHLLSVGGANISFKAS